MTLFEYNIIKRCFDLLNPNSLMQIQPNVMNIIRDELRKLLQNNEPIAIDIEINDNKDNTQADGEEPSA